MTIRIFLATTPGRAAGRSSTHHETKPSPECTGRSHTIGTLVYLDRRFLEARHGSSIYPNIVATSPPTHRRTRGQCRAARRAGVVSDAATNDGRLAGCAVEHDERNRLLRLRHDGERLVYPQRRSCRVTRDTVWLPRRDPGTRHVPRRRPGWRHHPRAPRCLDARMLNSGAVWTPVPERSNSSLWVVGQLTTPPVRYDRYW